MKFPWVYGFDIPTLINRLLGSYEHQLGRRKCYFEARHWICERVFSALSGHKDWLCFYHRWLWQCSWHGTVAYWLLIHHAIWSYPRQEWSSWHETSRHMEKLYALLALCRGFFSQRISNAELCCSLYLAILNKQAVINSGFVADWNVMKLRWNHSSVNCTVSSQIQ